MSDGKVVPFRRRAPSEGELEAYRRMTRGWSPELKQMMFPEYFRREQRAGEPDTRACTTDT